MVYFEFEQQFSPYQILSLNEIEKSYPGFNRMNLVNWQRKGYVQKLRNGWYRFNGETVNEQMLYLIANKIYSPSYVSFETAFSYYGIIPEGVFSITSATSQKTACFTNELGTFNYTSLKANLMFGYDLVRFRNQSFKMSQLEKAILDYVYIHHNLTTVDDFAELRLNKIILQKDLNRERLDGYLSIFNSKVLNQRINLFKQYIND
jgi:predicted transcriptional regulator of viral defense system